MRKAVLAVALLLLAGCAPAAAPTRTPESTPSVDLVADHLGTIGAAAFRFAGIAGVPQRVVDIFRIVGKHAERPELLQSSAGQLPGGY